MHPNPKLKIKANQVTRILLLPIQPLHKRAKKAGKAKRRLETIAGSLLRELERKMDGQEKARYGKERVENYYGDKKRHKCDKWRARAAIEPIIGHLKKGFRMEQNYLWGEKGIQTNAYMVATAWNLKKMMEKLGREFLYFILRIFFKQSLLFSLEQK